MLQDKINCTPYRCSAWRNRRLCVIQSRSWVPYLRLNLWVSFTSLITTIITSQDSFVSDSSQSHFCSSVYFILGSFNEPLYQFPVLRLVSKIPSSQSFLSIIYFLRLVISGFQFSSWFLTRCVNISHVGQHDLGHLDHLDLSLIHIWRCRRSTLCRSRWSPYH